MSYLITGASGQLGREWVRYAGQTGTPYIALGHTDLDITDLQKVERTLNDLDPHLVINCAAYTDVDGAESEPALAYKVNRDGVRHLSNICAELGIPMVHYSTDYVFAGSSKDKIRYPDGYSEDALAAPLNVYGKSKYAGEQALKESGCEHLMLRVSWLCGRFGSNFVKTMLRLGNDRDSVQVVDDQFASPAFADQVVEQTHHLLRKGLSGTFHLSSKGMISWADFASEIFSLAGIQANIERIASDEYPFKAERPKFSLLSTRKAESNGVEITEWRSGLKKLLKQIEC